jgi:hypothetical protein
LILQARCRIYNLKLTTTASFHTLSSLSFPKSCH